jgi:hypothetical protein
MIHDSYRYKFCGYVAVIIGLLPLMCRVWREDDKLTSPLPYGIEEAFSVFAAIIFALEQVFVNIHVFYICCISNVLHTCCFLCLIFRLSLSLSLSPYPLSLSLAAYI